MSSLQLVFEDQHVLVVNKPAGVLSQPGKTMDGSVATQIRAAYPDATGTMLVHRLDMDTSGLMVLAKTAEAQRALQQQFEQRLISKTYVAELIKKPTGVGGRIELPVRVDIDDRPRQIVCFEHGKYADTLWRHVEGTRINFTPITGRTHQLRVHAAHPLGLNACIVGDRLYGTPAQRLLLHAQSLGFVHPHSGQAVSFSSDTPF